MSEAGWSVYMLECRDGSLYTGVARDVVRRLSEHQRGTASKYTRSRLPLSLVYQEPPQTRSAALKREAQIKRLSRPGKLCLIAGQQKAP
jgi:putative endonuclease